MSEQPVSPDSLNKRLQFLLQLYNEQVSLIDKKLQLRAKKEAKLEENNFYPELVILNNTITTLKAKPRDYISYQFRIYKKSHFSARKFPSIRMISSSKSAERWIAHLSKTNNAPDIESLLNHSRQTMQDLMKSNAIGSEREFFEVPFFVSEMAPVFLKQNETFQQLVKEGYYEKTFSMKAEDLLK